MGLREDEKGLEMTRLEVGFIGHRGRSRVECRRTAFGARLLQMGIEEGRQMIDGLNRFSKL